MRKQSSPREADTSVDLDPEIAALTAMPYTEMRQAWQLLYRSHPPKKLNRDLLELCVAWKLQERALGGLSATTRRQLAELAQSIAAKADLAKARMMGLIIDRLAAKTGATADELVAATGWQRHSVLGALSRLRSRGFTMQFDARADRRADRLDGTANPPAQSRARR